MSLLINTHLHLAIDSLRRNRGRTFLSALGIAIGLVLYFNRKRINREKAEPDEKPEESSDAVREEEIIETTHCKYR